ncbi:MAG: DNA primase catalytic subunit PriS [Candidatus Micrarchaeota archaeon]
MRLPIQSEGFVEMITQFLRKKYSEYYSKNKVSVEDLPHREFGFGFNNKIDLRHKAFSSEEQLNNFLVNDSPMYVSYSLAHYKLPAAKPMDRKEFTGCDLVFDLDYAPIELGLFSEEYVSNVRDSALKLTEEYLPALGFSKKEIQSNFSGQKGFHVHVKNEAVQQLNQEARRQLTAFSETPSKTFFLKEVTKPKELIGPSKESGYWGKKFLNYCTEFIEKTSLDELNELGFNKKEWIDEKELITKNLRKGKWGPAKGISKLWEKLYEEFSKQNTVQIDAKVTIDLHRLIRLPESLHGSTGFKAVKTDLKSFSIEKAIAFGKNEVEITSTQTASFKLVNTYEFKAGEKQLVPEFVAVFAESKKIGEVKAF